MPKERAELVTFGLRIKTRREQLRMSQEELADLAEFDRTYISLIERGKRNLSLINVCRFARALRTTPARLVRGL